VSRITTDSASEHIVNAIITMCHGLELEVVAEGIEDFAEAKKLKLLGCDLGQGYYYGRPQDAETTLEASLRWQRDGFDGRPRLIRSA
jgi:EAL domain-containing protein (putative c-di-GMP-specific phosphodiesterase class I)